MKHVLHQKHKQNLISYGSNFFFFLTFGIATCLNYNIPNTYKEEKVPDGIIVTNNINKTEYSNIAFKI